MASTVLEARSDGLNDEPRPGGPRTITDEQVDVVLVATLERTPGDATHWSRTSMAKESGLAKSMLGYQGSSTGSDHCSVRDVVGLYLDPPDKALGPASTRRGWRLSTAHRRCGRQNQKAGVSRIGRWVGPRSELLIDQVVKPAAAMAEAWVVSSRSTAWPSMRVRVAPMHM